MSDIVERLQRWADSDDETVMGKRKSDTTSLKRIAAEEITNLRAELAEARDKTLDEAAGELERLDGFGEWWDAAQAIRALKSRSHTLSDLIASTADEYLSPKPPIL